MARFPAQIRPLSEWIEYNNYIQHQIQTKKLDIDPEEDYGGIDDFIKRLYRSSVINRELPSLSSVIDFPDAFCLPYTFFFPHVDLSVVEGVPDYNIEQTNLPFETIKNLNTKENQIIHALQTSKSSQFDISASTNALQEIITACKQGLPSMSLGLVLRTMTKSLRNMGHMVALVFWWDTKKDALVCGIYDPMFYFRPADTKKVDNKYYIWAINQVKLTMLLLGKLVNVQINILNISQYCHHSIKGIHCSQYVVPAEYCSMYSLYFLFLYAKHKYPQTPKEIQDVIEETFITPSAELIRETDAEKKFMFVKLSFIFTVLIYYVGNQNDDLNQAIYSIAKQINDKNTFDILHPIVREYFDSYIGSVEQREKERRREAIRRAEAEERERMVRIRLAREERERQENLERRQLFARNVLGQLIQQRNRIGGGRSSRKRVNKQNTRRKRRNTRKV